MDEEGDLYLRPQRSINTACRTIDQETVIIVLNEQKALILNNTGSRVWGLLDGKRSIKEIADTIAKEYLLKPKDAVADVQEFLKSMFSEGAIVWEKDG